MDTHISVLLQVAFGFLLLGMFWRLQERARARRQRLTTVTARFGLFVSWVATAVALIIGGFGVVGFYNAPAPYNEYTWAVYGGLCAGAFVVWLLGRGIYFVLAGSLPEEPKRSQALPRNQLYNAMPEPVRRSVPTSGPQAGPWERKEPTRP
jgi:hypothetical protein